MKKFSISINCEDYVNSFYSKKQRFIELSDNRKKNIENYFYKKKLSEREIEVAKLLLSDLKYREIGEILSVAERTVSTFVSRIYHKTRVSSKQQLKKIVNEL